MFYAINKEDGYIYGVVKGVSEKNANCTEAEYNEIKTMIMNAPIAPKGFEYRLRENLEWELCEFNPDTANAMATEEDYKSALENLGVNFNA